MSQAQDKVAQVPAMADFAGVSKALEELGIDLEDSTGRIDLVPKDVRSQGYANRGVNSSAVASDNFNLTSNSRVANAYDYNPSMPQDGAKDFFRPDHFSDVHPQV